MTVNIIEVQKQQYNEVIEVLIRDYGFVRVGISVIAKNISGGLTGGALNPTGNRTGFVASRGSHVYLVNGLGELFNGTVQEMYCGWEAKKLAAEFMKKVNNIASEK